MDEISATALPLRIGQLNYPGRQAYGHLLAHAPGMTRRATMTVILQELSARSRTALGLAPARAGRVRESMCLAAL